jgi:hypothetical protein
MGVRMRLLGIVLLSALVASLCGCGRKGTGRQSPGGQLPDSTPAAAWSSILTAMKDRRELEINRLLTTNAIRTFRSFRRPLESLDKRDVLDWYADFARHWEKCDFRWDGPREGYAKLTEVSKLKATAFVFVNRNGWKLDSWYPGQ